MDYMKICKKIANKHDFQFKMGFVVKECDKIEWYYKGIRIAPINGIIKPFTTNTQITRKRNPNGILRTISEGRSTKKLYN